VSGAGGLGDLERAVAIAELKARVLALEERAVEDRDDCEKEREKDRKKVKEIEDEVGALRRFQAWLMAGIMIIGFVAGRALNPIIDRLFK